MAPEILVRYRHVGGPVGVDQNLTVYEDGQAKLEEHHRSRDATSLTLSGDELAQLRAALDRIPEEFWAAAPMLALHRGKAVMKGALTAWGRPKTDPARFELRYAGRAISGDMRDAGEVDAVRALLDDLRIKAIRLAEEQAPS